jgi:hypothetical protein
MKEIILSLLLLTFIGCKDNREKGAGQTEKSIKMTEAKEKEADFYKENAFFNQDKGDYHYKNVQYFFDDIGMSPIYLGGLLVKETREVKGSNQSEGQITTITLDIMTDEKKRIGDKTFKKDCDEAKLYSHFIETANFSPGGGWDNIQLYKYDNYSSPFLTSDEQYWFFNMNSDNQHISKNCYFVTFEKFPKGYACILRLSDMNGVLQEVRIKNSNEANHEIEFMYPQISFTSDNPYQYTYHADQSSHCNTISISPKDHSNLRKHLTKSAFKLVFYDNQEKADSLSIPIDNGQLFGKTDKTFDIEIYK